MNQLIRLGTLALALAVVGCGTEPVFRSIELHLSSKPLPSSKTTLVGNILSLTATGLEMSGDNSRYVVWANGDAGSTALGEYVPNANFSIDLSTVGVLPSEIAGLMVTEESTGTALPVTPSNQVHLRGPVEGALDFTPLTPLRLAEASGVIELRARHIHVMTSALPTLPVGLHYGIWIFWEGGDHGDSAKALLVDSPTAAGMFEEMAPELIADARSAKVTLESDGGMTTMPSPVVILEGEVELPESGAEAGGGHMH